MPKGKKREPSLREKEKQIEANLFDRIVTNGGNYTVLELVEKYVSLKTGVRFRPHQYSGTDTSHLYAGTRPLAKSDYGYLVFSHSS